MKIIVGKISLKKIIALIIGFLGVYLSIYKGKFCLITLKKTNSLPLLLVFLASICFALFSIVSKNIKKDALLLNTFYFLCATVAGFFSLLFLNRPITFPPKNSLLPIIINGTLVNGISYVLWVEALKRISTPLAASLVFLTPILGASYLIIFFHEPFNSIYIFSLILVLLSGLFSKNTMK